MMVKVKIPYVTGTTLRSSNEYYEININPNSNTITGAILY